MNWNKFGKIMEAVDSVEGVHASFIYANRGKRLVPYRESCWGENPKLFKAYGYNWNQKCLGEVEWDGKCFFAPEDTDIIRFIIVEENADIAKLVERIGGVR